MDTVEVKFSGEYADQLTGSFMLPMQVSPDDLETLVVENTGAPTGLAFCVNGQIITADLAT